MNSKHNRTYKLKKSVLDLPLNPDDYSLIFQYIQVFRECVCKTFRKFLEKRGASRSKQQLNAEDDSIVKAAWDDLYQNSIHYFLEGTKGYIKDYRPFQYEHPNEDDLFGGCIDTMKILSIEEELSSRKEALVRSDGEIIGLDLPLHVAAAAVFDLVRELDETDSIHAIMVIFKVRRPVAIRLYALRSIFDHFMAMSYLMGFSKLRCMDALHFISPGEIRYFGDLLIRLTYDEKKLVKSELTTVITSFTEEARVAMFKQLITSAAMVCTTFQYLPNIQEKEDYVIRINDIKTALNAFSSTRFNSSTMPDQRKGSNTTICDGFNLCSETCKVLLDEIKRECEMLDNTSTKQFNEKTVSDRFDVCSSVIIEEMLSYLYLVMEEKPTIADYVAHVLPYAQTFLEKILRLLNATPREEYARFSEARLTAAVTRVANGQPTMGELRFSPDTFNPSVNIYPDLRRDITNYDVPSLVRRARFVVGLPPRETKIVARCNFHSTHDSPIIISDESKYQVNSLERNCLQNGSSYSDLFDSNNSNNNNNNNNNIFYFGNISRFTAPFSEIFSSSDSAAQKVLPCRRLSEDERHDPLRSAKQSSERAVDRVDQLLIAELPPRRRKKNC